MIQNNFAQEYETYKVCEAEYDSAADEAGKEAARQKVRGLLDSMADKPEGYNRMFNMYKDAKERGNEYIDVSECIWDRDVEPMVSRFRSFGITHFTFSSTWSSAVETAWLFTQNGCTLEGIVEINSQYSNFGGEGYEKAHGYLFKVN
ncbi:MAG: hypothetical protein LUG99_09110 [Lachnospiraceae bacterium]|nr:hypothetical protein [Lachnospiraceae bacterium]